MKKPYAIHLLLVAIFPILFVLSANLNYFPLGVILLPMVAMITLALLLWLLIDLVLKAPKKSALLASVLLYMLFADQFISDQMNMSWTLGSVKIGPGKFAIGISAIVCASAALFLFRTRRKMIVATKLANIMAVCLVGVCALRITIHELNVVFFHVFEKRVQDTADNRPNVPQSGARPDIFYIILDSYARSDVLEELYGFDNSDFLEYLRRKGFYVADRSRSNYGQTALSLTATLNMDYIPNLTKGSEAGFKDRSLLRRLSRNNKVSSFLKECGYTLVAFGPDIFVDQRKNVDVYITPGWSLNQFQNAVIGLTPVPRILIRLFPGNLFYKGWVLYPIEHLAQVRDIDGPVFVFAHLLPPHPPFIFDKDGKPPADRILSSMGMAEGNWLIKPDGITPEQYIEGYTGQLAYLNKKMKQALDELLADPSYGPVIIIQSDHGPGLTVAWETLSATNFKERLSNLNVFYFPDGNYDTLYPEISSVNTFRVIFNKYFGTTYDMKEDDSYLSTWSHPYKFFRYETP